MDLIVQLEQLRYSDDELVNASGPDYWEYLGANNMLDECLKIIVKWMGKKKLEFEII